MNQSDSNERLPRAKIAAVQALSTAVVTAERVAVASHALEPVDEPHPRPHELGIGGVVDSVQQTHRGVAVLTQVGERQAAELQVREAACRSVARVQMVAALQSVLDAMAKELDAFVDRLVPVRRKHRPQEVHARKHGGLVELVRQVHAELGESVGAFVVG